MSDEGPLDFSWVPSNNIAHDQVQTAIPKKHTLPNVSDIPDYYIKDGIKVYTNKGQEKFTSISASDYRKIKDELFGVEVMGYDLNRLSIQKRKDIWNDLHNQLLTHIRSLKELFPYQDFSSVYKKAEDIVFRIRYDSINTNTVAMQYSSLDYPFILIHIEPSHMDDAHSLTSLRHEFTHFCCNFNQNIGNLNVIPSLLYEGITQQITNKVLKHEPNTFDNKSIEYASHCYEVFTKIAQIYITLVGEKTVVNSYFEYDMSHINKELGKYFDQEFIKHLNMELHNLSMCANEDIWNNKMPYESIYEFPYFIKFMNEAANIFNTWQEHEIAMINKEKIRYIFSSFDTFFAERKINGKAVLR